MDEKEISEKLKTVLEDPGALQALFDTARALAPMRPEGERGVEKPISKRPPDRETALLQALLPYLSAPRRALLEKLLQMQQLRRLLGGFGK